MSLIKNKKKHICIFSGEKSGDLYGSYLIKELNKNNEFNISGMGGSLMRNSGAKLNWNIDDLSIMGFSEVLFKLKSIIKLLKDIKEYLIKTKPDIIICIDNWGLNSKICSFAKSIGIKTAYFICPKFWIWNFSRVKKLSKLADIVFPIFNFEYEPLIKNNNTAFFYGHPLKEILNKENIINKNIIKNKYNIHKNDIVITLMPGSRPMEIKKLSLVFYKIYNFLTKKRKLKFFLIISDSVKKMKEFEIFNNKKNIIIIDDNNRYNIMNASDLIIAASGTVSLEAMFLNIPIAVFYKVNIFSFFIAKYLLNIKYISLPNIIANKYIVPEFIQYFNIQDISMKIIKIFDNKKKINKIKKDMKKFSNIITKDNVIENISNKLKEVI